MSRGGRISCTLSSTTISPPSPNPTTLSTPRTAASSACNVSPMRWTDLKAAVTPPRGVLSRTEYIRKDSPTRIRVTRRHHPLHGQELEVLTQGKRHIVVRSADGLSMKLPRLWTDVDGAGFGGDSSGDAAFTVESLRELSVLHDALAQRESGRRSDSSEVPESPAR